MLIPTHIISPKGLGVPKLIAHAPLPDCRSYQVRALSDNEIYAETNEYPTEWAAIAKWNSAFSSAPIQYTDKGKVCD